MRIRGLLVLALLLLPVACGDDGEAADDPTTTTVPVTTTTEPLEPARPFGEGPALVGHRGGAGDSSPDNSLEALAAARGLGADWVEIDVRLSADGEVVLNHDPETPGGLVVATSTAAELAEEGVPTLTEALDVVDEHQLGIDVEIKSDPTEEHYDPDRGVADATVAVLTDRPPAGPLVVTSFDRGVVDRVVELTADEIPTALIAAGLGDPAQLVTDLLDAGHDGLALEFEAATAAVLRTLIDGGLTLWSWTVNDLDEATRLVEAGVEGIITDDPGAVGPAIDGAG